MDTPFDFLFHDIASLPGVGPARRGHYQKLMGERVVDALWHLPVNVQTRLLLESFKPQHADLLVTFKATILEHTPSRRYGKPYRIAALNQANQPVELLFFYGRAPYLNKLAKTGDTVTVSGKLTFRKFLGAEKWQLSHPDFIGPLAELNDWTGTERIYPLTAGINQGMVRSVIKKTLKQLPSIPEWLDAPFLDQNNWPSWPQALHDLHHAKVLSDLEISHASKKRLIYDELLAHQLSLLLTHRQTTSMPAVALNPPGFLTKTLIDQLPFQLTSCQLKASQEISYDLQQSHQSLRLLQGDVGSGKTIVALLAALQAIESGCQATLLVPTDILARQHYQTLKRLTALLKIHVAILTGREKGKLRNQILADLESGKINLLIGTHAIIQSPVTFHQLGLAIIDEQHRFGVKQRLALSSKGLNPHILSMTATPIPRTLMLVNYGDMDVSTLDQKPPGRQTITTRVLPISRLDEVVEGLKRKFNIPNEFRNLDSKIRGERPECTEEYMRTRDPAILGDQVSKGKGYKEKIYWVCPLVEESETLDVTAAIERYSFLETHFPGQVALVHGRLKSQEKESAMEQFTQGPANILVATTVIEVGIDVPAATIIVIEHAERFGLAQLHQLRGRVGRGASPSSCLLLYGQPLTPIARKRLAAIRDSEDGFVIAEADLKLRGGGEILGLRQSGLPKFKLFDLTDNPDETMEEYNDLFTIATSDAKQILASDPQLQSERGQALQLLLRLFKHEQALQYRRSG